MRPRNASFSSVFKRLPAEEGNLIPLLQKAQAEYGYISDELVGLIANHLGMTSSQVFGVASFYSQFRFTPPAKHSVSVCLGTACHVSGGETLLDAFEREMNIRPGESTPDMKFGLSRVACLGCCALAPVVKIDEDIFSKVNVVKLKELWSRYE
jgi:NADH-quinone oxidoreductase subunit E